jgi:hypothetical protein
LRRGAVDLPLLDFTANFLRNALTNLGIGGKTSSGMGRFGKSIS